MDPAGRSNVKRIILTVVLPVFLSAGVSTNQAKQLVMHHLRSAIQSGELLKLAHPGQ